MIQEYDKDISHISSTIVLSGLEMASFLDLIQKVPSWAARIKFFVVNQPCFMLHNVVNRNVVVLSSSFSSDLGYPLIENMKF